jgi:serine/threonine-protein kinase
MLGQILNDRYEVLEKIGEGGMAIAYRGRDRVLGRTVAIKVMRPELAADAEFLSRFRREARAAAGVVHEHVAGVYDTGDDGSYHYIVMEYVEGESLRDRLRREGPLPLEEALRIATETAEALEAAHSVGVIHRDIKPHNILLGREGQVKVSDFGIARAMSAPQHTDTGRILGTANYVSPEQARGDVVGPQGDIYSLGATLFEMLIGRPPFDGGEPMATLHKHIYDRPPQPSALRPGLPHEVDSVIAHCLEKDLSRRFASARELRSYLLACPRTELVPWRRGLRRIGWRRALLEQTAAAAAWGRRRALWLGVMAVVIGALVVALASWSPGGGAPGMVRVPDVVGMASGAAQEYLEGEGLGYRQVGSRPHEDIAKGAVVSQDPRAGLVVPVASVVKVVLSTGPQQVGVPNVAEMSVAAARRNLEGAGLVAGDSREAYHATIPAGYVTGTLPAAGKRVLPGTKVDIVVSLGPQPSLPPGPALPRPPNTGPGREEIIAYTLPADLGAGQEARVKVQVTDDKGTRVIYEGAHKPGEAIPPQTLRITSPTTVRILVNDEPRWEESYLP